MKTIFTVVIFILGVPGFGAQNNTLGGQRKVFNQPSAFNDINEFIDQIGYDLARLYRKDNCEEILNSFNGPDRSLKSLAGLETVENKVKQCLAELSPNGGGTDGALIENLATLLYDYHFLFKSNSWNCEYGFVDKLDVRSFKDSGASDVNRALDEIGRKIPKFTSDNVPLTKIRADRNDSRSGAQEAQKMYVDLLAKRILALRPIHQAVEGTKSNLDVFFGQKHMYNRMKSKFPNLPILGKDYDSQKKILTQKLQELEKLQTDLVQTFVGSKENSGSHFLKEYIQENLSSRTFDPESFKKQALDPNNPDNFQKRVIEATKGRLEDHLEVLVTDVNRRAQPGGSHTHAFKALIEGIELANPGMTPTKLAEGHPLAGAEANAWRYVACKQQLKLDTGRAVLNKTGFLIYNVAFLAFAKRLPPPLIKAGFFIDGAALLVPTVADEISAKYFPKTPMADPQDLCHGSYKDLHESLKQSFAETSTLMDQTLENWFQEKPQEREKFRSVFKGPF